jgi:hypothetical protein
LEGSIKLFRFALATITLYQAQMPIFLILKQLSGFSGAVHVSI